MLINMAQTLFRDLQLKEGAQQRVEGDSYIFEEHNPLDEGLLREVETELVALTGCSKKDRVRITVLGLEDFSRAVRRLVPKRYQERGLAKHIRVLQDPRDPHHIIVGPSALAGLNEGHALVTTDLVYHLISASGTGANQAFERGASDLLARELAARLNLDIFTDQYPKEREFTTAFIEAVKDVDDDVIELVGLLKKNPRQFFNLVKESPFYKWWTQTVKKDDRFSPYVNLIDSITSPNAQLEGSFMAWSEQCATMYCSYRAEQSRKGKLAAAKRAKGSNQ